MDNRPNPTPPILTEKQEKRFWELVNQTDEQGPNGDCWEWMGYRDKKGYGSYTLGHRGRGLRASRLAFYLSTKKWPRLQICHHCDNPSCCRPDHLFEDTQQGNMDDCVAKKRVATGTRCGMYTHPESRLYGDKNPMRKYPELVKRGSQHPTAKLTEEQVIEMRNLYASGEYSHRNLARKYNVGHSTVSRIVNRKITWLHI